MYIKLKYHIYNIFIIIYIYYYNDIYIYYLIIYYCITFQNVKHININIDIITEIKDIYSNKSFSLKIITLIHYTFYYIKQSEYS